MTMSNAVNEVKNLEIVRLSAIWGHGFFNIDNAKLNQWMED